MSASTGEDGSWLRRLVQSSESDSSDSTRSHIRVPLRASLSAVGRTLPRSPSNTRSNPRGIIPSGMNIHRRIIMYSKRPRRPELWLPGNRDSDDWRRCHGMSNKEYERTKRRISQIMRFAEEDADEDLRSSVKFGHSGPQVCIQSQFY